MRTYHEDSCAVCQIAHYLNNQRLRDEIIWWCAYTNEDFECIAEQLLAEEMTK